MASATNHPPTEADSAMQELEYKAYQLGLLNEYLRELNFLDEEHDILEQFLLMCMGAVGADKSLLLVFDQAGEPALHRRGFAESQSRTMQEQAAGWSREYFKRIDPENELLPKQVLEIDARQGAPRRETALPWPDDAAYILRWTLNAGCFGFLALGAKLDGTSYTDLDRDFLPQLVEILMDSLQSARSRPVTAGLHRTHLCRFSIESTIQHASIKTFFLLHLAIFYALWILFTGICNNFRVLMIFPLNCALEKDFDAT